MLMVAAGVVGGLMMTIVVVIVVLVQVLERLLPLMLVGLLVAIVVIVVQLVRRQPGQQASHTYQVLPPPPAASPVAANDHAATYLRWGPQRCEDLDAPVASPGAIHGRWP
jgi:hypothetical protein